MIKLKYLLVLLVTIFLLKDSVADNYADKLDELMTKYDKAELFSGVVLLARDGNILYEKSFGYADWNKQISNNNQTLFFIASITKTFTREIVIQLEKEGKLSFSDPLSKYVSIYPDEIGNKITIQMLLDMKAGLGDYLRNPAYRQNAKNFRTINDYLELIKNEPLLFEPGTNTEYSNSGYAVLGGVIEKASGKSYADNLKERFFEPLGMNNSYYRQMDDALPNSAMGTEINFVNKKRSLPLEISPSPAGGIFTNAEDMLKFDAFMKKTHPGVGEIDAGGTPTWNSIFAQYKNGYTLIVLSNFGRAAEEVEQRFNKILKNENYSEPNLPVGMTLYKALKEGGADGLEKNLKNILEQNDLMYNDMHLNKFGYELLQAGEPDLALEVFKLNAKLFPDIANVYDSLAEAYMNMGNNELAIENYKKVLAIRPQNENAKKMLEELSK
ncbi:MAG: serine hydrolase [Ignavibacteria bacterium]|nr:serine hydrolase [Ignavibacteria bacterium]